MTTFQHPESPFKSDHTASNMAGFTLMNNQVGAVVAQVLAKKDNVKVTYLPSMIRVDGTGTFELDYDEVSEALGYEPGYFDAAEFEENMSTHYGRMIHQDDRTIMFANPEDAADYLGFDLVAKSITGQPRAARAGHYPRRTGTNLNVVFAPVALSRCSTGSVP